MIGNSIKFKYSLFLAFLLVITILLTSVVVLKGIRDNQRDSLEKELLQQTRVANLSVKQAYLTSSPVDPQLFLHNRGQQLAMDLAFYTGLHVVLYDKTGKQAGDSVPISSAYGVDEALGFALSGKIAYVRKGNEIIYLTPLQGPNEQMGVLQFHYSLEDDNRFYDAILQQFLYVGAAVLVLSFILGYLYFGHSASAIIALNRAAEQIRRGQFLHAPTLNRKDELGQLSRGIYYMSSAIRNNIDAMLAEETKLRLAVSKLQQLEKEQKQFIGNISHEFKTPLTSIKAYVELQEMYPDDEALQKDAVRDIGQETKRLTDMVDKALRLSALEKYDFEDESELLDVRQALNNMIGRMKAKAERFEVTLTQDLTPATLWINAENFDHIMVNLLDNAIKYNVPGGRVTVSSRENSDSLIIDVTDTGIGIPEEARDKIFEPFYTANKDRSRKTGGTGLGLALVKQLVTKYGGNVEFICSEAGSTFRLRFPKTIAVNPAP
jgi:two-component system, OmpR family, phosphate regulon sensor histidine kinase PhoR